MVSDPRNDAKTQDGADLIRRCLEACSDCALACSACAGACLTEDRVADLAPCIRSDLDCAELCTVTGSVLARRADGDTRGLRALVEACRQACLSCAEECEKHARMHDHCRVCAEACRRCVAACDDLLATLQ
ncbi:four-helix bundle copper-binding protein [Pseudoclavibacter sp. RFBA6]|nr:four-helix bundle copper-binding protein [Pseudoclavibacter sp. RFBA6]